MRIKKSWIITPVVAVALSVAGVAIAAMVVTGANAGKASGTVGTPVAVTESPGTIDGTIWPDGTNTCTFMFHNTNGTQMKVDTMTPTGIVEAYPVSGGQDFTASAFPDGNFKTLSPNVEVPAGGQVQVAVADCVEWNGNVGTADEGATFTVHYDITSEVG